MFSSEKNWKKRSDYEYELLGNKSRLATFKLHPNASGNKAEILTGDAYYTIQRTGFWKTTIVLSDQYDQEILRAQPGKWYANKFSIWFLGEQLNGEIWNNPLAELIISAGDQEILCYGLDRSEGETESIVREYETTHILLHIFCWFIYLPVIHENSVMQTGLNSVSLPVLAS